MPGVALFIFVFVHEENKLKQSALFSALHSLLITPAIYADTVNSCSLELK